MNNLVFLIIAIFLTYIVLTKMNYNIPNQKNIQDLSYAKNKKPLLKEDIIVKDNLIETTGLDYPQISGEFIKLSEGEVKPLNNDQDFMPNSKDNIEIIRDTSDNMNTKRIYLPDFFRKDRLNGNDKSSGLKIFNDNLDESDKAWSDDDISSQPSFYTSEIKNELTNIGLFFDKNNQYNDKTSPNTEVLPNQSCYIDKFGNNFCEDNTRLQNIPPSLITDVNKCEILNSIGSYKNKLYELPDFNEKVMNGGLYYNNISGSLQKNEYNSPPLQPLVGTCSI
jgi:hypothetical protein